MTERGLPSVDGAPACPFVAFEDDRESRSTSPDHRHRCYAEPVPAPRAAAHQEAYCLSSAFPVCPTFQDWARREAAHARGEGAKPAPAPTATATAAAAAGSIAAGDTDPGDDLAEDERAHSRDPSDAPPIRRNPPRDWAAPPPWAPGGAGASSAPGQRWSAEGRAATEGSGTPDFLAGRDDESRGLAGSAADRLATGEDVAAVLGGPAALSSPGPSAAPAAHADAELAELVAPARVGDRPVPGRQTPPRPGNRPRVSSTRAAPPRDAIVGPAWERSRRYEAYPTIRTRVGLPQLPRLAVLAVALAVAALGLFFLPALLGVGGGGTGTGPDPGSASPSASGSLASSSPQVTTPPAPTAQVYVVKAGDTMSTIAARYGMTSAALCAANKDTIKNCDKIGIGNQIVIPATAPTVVNDASAAPSPS